MRKKVLTKQCGICEDAKMNDNNQLYCDWGESKVKKLLEPPKRKGGYPNCNINFPYETAVNKFDKRKK